jgi:predicted flap endonuclease-1-like 5' DNA nuclease
MPDTSDDDSEVVAMSEFSAPQVASDDTADDDFGAVFSAKEEPEILDEDDFEIEQMFAAGSAEHETPAAEHVVDKAPEPIGDGEDVNAHDDLKMIKGIGPSIEKTLNDLGVYRFHQIAEMSEYDIDRVAQQLRGFRSRIYREDWIGQARDLQYQKNNDRS